MRPEAVFEKCTVSHMQCTKLLVCHAVLVFQILQHDKSNVWKIYTIMVETHPNALQPKLMSLSRHNNIIHSSLKSKVAYLKLY